MSTYTLTDLHVPNLNLKALTMIGFTILEVVGVYVCLEKLSVRPACRNKKQGGSLGTT